MTRDSVLKFKGIKGRYPPHPQGMFKTNKDNFLKTEVLGHA